MYCENCKESFDDSLEFCPYCGRENDKIKYCPKCETSYYNVEHCKCGRKLLTREEYANKLKNNLISFFESHSWILDEEGQREIFYRRFEFDDEVLEKLIKLDKTTGKYWIFALYILLLGKDNGDDNSSNKTSSDIYEKELHYLNKAKELNPKSIFYWYGKIELFLRCESYEKVLDIIDMKIEKSDDDSLNTLFRNYEPIIYDSLNISVNWETIIPYRTQNTFPTTLKFKPLILIKAECLDKLGRIEEASDYYEKFFELEEEEVRKCPKCEKKFKEPFPEAGILYPDYGIEYDENFCHHCDINTDEKYNSFFSQCINYVDNEEYEKSVECCDSIIKSKSNFSVYYYKALSLYALEKYPEAINSCNNAIVLDNLDKHSWILKAECYAELDNPEKERYCYYKAMKCCDKIIKLNKKCFSAWEKKTECLKKLGKIEEAINCYDKRIKIAPSSFYKNNSLLGKAEFLNELERYDEAVEIYDKLIELEPDDTDYYTNKLDCLKNLKRYDAVIECYDKLIKIEQKYSLYFNKVYYLKKMGKYEEALECYEKLISAEPKFTFYNDYRAQCLEEMGKYEEALECYEKLIDLEREDLSRHLKKIECLEKLGRDEEAKDARKIYYDLLFEK